VNFGGNPDDLVVGIHFGTLSGRAVVVRIRDGEVLGPAIHPYAHGVIDQRASTPPITHAAPAGAVR
jgi:L-ribulokinase